MKSKVFAGKNIVNAIVVIFFIVGSVLVLIDSNDTNEISVFGALLIILGFMGFAASVGNELATLRSKIKALEDKNEKD